MTDRFSALAGAAPDGAVWAVEYVTLEGGVLTRFSDSEDAVAILEGFAREYPGCRLTGLNRVVSEAELASFKTGEDGKQPGDKKFKVTFHSADGGEDKVVVGWAGSGGEAVARAKDGVDLKGFKGKVSVEETKD
jgi:hypothetical protein